MCKPSIHSPAHADSFAPSQPGNLSAMVLSPSTISSVVQSTRIISSWIPIEHKFSIWLLMHLFDNKVLGCPCSPLVKICSEYVLGRIVSLKLMIALVSTTISPLYLCSWPTRGFLSLTLGFLSSIRFLRADPRCFTLLQFCCRRFVSFLNLLETFYRIHATFKIPYLPFGSCATGICFLLDVWYSNLRRVFAAVCPLIVVLCQL